MEEFTHASCTVGFYLGYLTQSSHLSLQQKAEVQISSSVEFFRCEAMWL